MIDMETAGQNLAALLRSGLAVQDVLKALSPVGKAMQEAWDICEARYRAAGAPYGDTEKGMIRWYREMYRR